MAVKGFKEGWSQGAFPAALGLAGALSVLWVGGWSAGGGLALALAAGGAALRLQVCTLATRPPPNCKFGWRRTGNSISV
jgi:hypothetical protein